MTQHHPTDAEREQITKTLIRMFNWVQSKKVPPEIACSASMLLTANLCAASENSVEDIVWQFRICLGQAREEMIQRGAAGVEKAAQK